jgi:hypothetical protein
MCCTDDERRQIAAAEVCRVAEMLVESISDTLDDCVSSHTLLKKRSRDSWSFSLSMLLYHRVAQLLTGDFPVATPINADEFLHWWNGMPLDDSLKVAVNDHC